MSDPSHPRPDFQALVGHYTGTSRVYFRPDELADATTIEGEITVADQGRFLQFAYSSTVQGKQADGVLLLAYDSALGQFLMTWRDTFHNGERLLHLTSERGLAADLWQASGLYPADETTDWGWRIEVLPQGEGQLQVQHFNLPPFLPEGALGVDWQLRRVDAPPHL